MPRRNNDIPLELDSPRGRVSINNSFESRCTKQGELFTDLGLKQWRLGKPIGIGGFGEIYLASDDLSREIKTDTSYVAKVEKHTNGPLFVEINCYLRIAKEYMVEHWKQQHNLSHLGMPHYVASGSHVIEDEKYRFLIIPRYKKDLERILRQNKYFNLKTVLTISYQIMDVLEYIHHHGYIHSDIKAQNIMLESPVKSKSKEVAVRKRGTAKKTQLKRKPRKLRNLRPINYNDDMQEFFDFIDKAKLSSPKAGKNEEMCDKIYLLDYGLASKYRQLNGEHKEFCTDERKAHAGTILFCSRDAHKGVPSRRSDLESLGYNIIYWLTGNLLWSEDVDDPAVVERKKNKCMADIPNFLGFCFNGDCPKFLMEYFTYIEKLKFEEYPNYQYCRQLFKKAVNEYGYKDDMRLDLENLEGWGSKQKKIKSCGRENIKPRVLISMGPPKFVVNSKTNVIFKRPKLRKKAKANTNDSMMNWSKILVDNPEEIFRAARERKNTEGSDSGGANILDMDIESMNPTYAMLEVYNKYKEQSDISPRYKGESTVEHVEGYTPAMMSVLIKKIERDLIEEEKIFTKNMSTKRSKGSKGPSKKKRSQIVKKVETPRYTRVTRSTSALNNNNKKSSPPKKSKSVPITRQKNSLRG
ncbi:unnamed protein product [Brassicogethes aeneus]|uniref:non-specific serine/threonine protein kinase n=1 Tax=Brassicogethes aeneus TaxID=1431903 RepID=A0A9P0AT62_BRAAE|nr:unnamed protein product [Brassicogethes aeneus]